MNNPTNYHGGGPQGPDPIVSDQHIRIVKVDEFRNSPMLQTEIHTLDRDVTTFLITDCGHYYRLNNMSMSLLGESHTGKVTCPKHIRRCFDCGKSVCIAGSADGKLYHREDDKPVWLCDDCHKKWTKKYNQSKSIKNFLDEFLGKKHEKR